MGSFLTIFDWPHCMLLGGATLGGLLVGIGILKDSKEWSVGAILVLIGVIIEPLFTLGLFVYDETISQGQRAEIIRLTTPRELSPDAVARVKAKVCPYGPQVADLTRVTMDELLFANELDSIWKTCKWQISGPGEDRDAAIASISKFAGIRFWYPSARANELKGVSEAFARALSDEGIAAFAAPIPNDAALTTDKVHIQIGQRP